MEPVHLLSPVILILAVGIIALILMRVVNLSAIVGYLLAGMLIGEHGLGLIEETPTTHLLAELGVVFLLFDIGLHFSLRHIWKARRDILGFGPLQVGLCALAFTAIAILMEVPQAVALITGITLALSSTAVVVQTLADQDQQQCPVGVSATAILIFQDICAIFLLVFASSLSQSDTGLSELIAYASLKALIAFVAAMFIGRYLIKPLFAVLAKTQREEIFTASALLIVLATASATAALDLSMTLGAFLAGMIISETSYRHVIQTEIKPFRGLLLGFFFITVGMSLNTHILLMHWQAVIVVIMVMLLIKTFIITVIARLLGFQLSSAIQSGFLLAQGSEFAFVLFSSPAVSAALGETYAAILMTSVVGSIAMTPMMVIIGKRLANRLLAKKRDEQLQADIDNQNQKAPVVVFGMGAVGRKVVDALIAHQLPYIAIEMDYDRFVKANRDGYRVAFGDAGDLRLMETVEMSRASSIIITIVRYEVSRDLTPVVDERYPHLTRFISVNDEADKQRFEQLGMQAIIDNSHPSGIDMAAAVLESRDVDARDIQKWLDQQQQIALEINTGKLKSIETAE